MGAAVDRAREITTAIRAAGEKAEMERIGRRVQASPKPETPAEVEARLLAGRNDKFTLSDAAKRGMPVERTQQEAM